MVSTETSELHSGDTAVLYRAAIGPRSQEYYLRHFARFDSQAHAGVSWNWAAYWTTINWLAYRKMWGWLLIYVGSILGLALLVLGLGKLVVGYSDFGAILLALGLLTAAFVVPGLFANAWFYNHCNGRITVALRTTQDLAQAAANLEAQAPGRRRLGVLALINALILGLMLAAYLLWPGNEVLTPAAAPPAPLVGKLDDPDAPAQAVGAVNPASAAVAPASSPSPAASAPATAASGAPAAADSGTVAKATPAAVASAVVAVKTPDKASSEVAAPPSVAASAPAAAASAPAAPRRYVWLIQVGAFAQAENAAHAVAQIRELGLDAGSEPFRTRQGDELIRVRVGPFSRQVEAEEAARRIRTLDLPTMLLRQRRRK